MIAAVGTFDGVHLGHGFLLAKLKEAARERGLRPVAVTFDRHPLSVIAPQGAPKLLTADPEVRNRLLRAHGVDVITLPFNDSLRRMTGSEFAAMLRRDHGVNALMLGYNNHLGSDRSTAPEAEGVEIVRCQEYPDAPNVSSSAIRNLIAEGNLAEAEAMLGHPFIIAGTVGHGKQLGRKLGFPTANVEASPLQLLPPPGVYAATVLGRPAVVNIGHRPTVDPADSPLSIEAHIDRFSGNLYDSRLELCLIDRLRSEQRFDSLDDLRNAIASDLTKSRQLYHGSQRNA